MNVVRVPEKEDWVMAYGRGRFRRWLKRRLLRPGYLFLAGLGAGSALGFLWLAM